MLFINDKKKINCNGVSLYILLVVVQLVLLTVLLSILTVVTILSRLPSLIGDTVLLDGTNHPCVGVPKPPIRGIGSGQSLGNCVATPITCSSGRHKRNLPYVYRLLWEFR